MRTIFYTVICFVLGCNSQPAEHQEPTIAIDPANSSVNDPREELDTAISEALRQLKNNEFERFVTNFMSPAEQQQLTGLKITDLDKVMQPLAGELIWRLQGAQKMQPVLEYNGTLARFNNVLSDGRNLVFEKTGKYWYIQGATPDPGSPE